MNSVDVWVKNSVLTRDQTSSSSPPPPSLETQEAFQVAWESLHRVPAIVKSKCIVLVVSTLFLVKDSVLVSFSLS